MGGRGGLRHFNANLLITPTPEGAKGSVYLLLFDARNVPATIVETAIYEDTLVKTSQGWKFKKRLVWRDDDDITPFKPKPLPQALQAR
jgi:SnoaL-like domain